MGKLLLLVVAAFVVAMMAPELRSLLFVGAVCLISGYVAGMQHKGAADAELHANRAERSVSNRMIEA